MRCRAASSGPVNRLGECTSPYLLQHAENPVTWQPWDEQALALARELDRPLLVSIGYAACHWCHVMEHESFEDEAMGKDRGDASWMAWRCAGMVCEAPTTDESDLVWP